MLVLGLLIAGFIVLSGTWVLIDAAILSISLAEVEEMIGDKLWGARDLKEVIQHLTRVIIVISIFTNLTNIICPILIGHMAGELFHSTGIGILTAILTVATILFSEIMPKALGSHYSPTISRITAPFLRIATFVLSPLVWLLEKFVHLFKTGEREIGTEEQIRALVNMGGTAGHIDTDEKNLIHRAFKLNDRKAKDIMKPINDIVALPMTLTIKQAARIVFQNPFSRYPVYGTSLDDVGGMVFSHDVLQLMAEDKDKESIRTVLREVLFVDAAERADDLLTFFRKKQIHMAVVQSGGKNIGIVTLEDVLEELVGEIEDERDVSQKEEDAKKSQ